MKRTNNTDDLFYNFGAKMPLSDFAVSPDIFEQALKENDFSEKRKIHMQLCWGDYLEGTQFPIVFHPADSDGKNFKDVLGMRYASYVFLISDKFKAVLEDNGVTGWKSYPVEIYGKKGERILGYNGFSVTGRGGAMAEAYLEWEIARNMDWHYDPSQWDGSDIFKIYPAYLTITRRVKDLLVSAGITGVEYTPLSECVIITTSTPTSTARGIR